MLVLDISTESGFSSLIKLPSNSKVIWFSPYPDAKLCIRSKECFKRMSLIITLEECVIMDLVSHLNSCAGFCYNWLIHTSKQCRSKCFQNVDSIKNLGNTGIKTNLPHSLIKKNRDKTKEEQPMGLP